MTYSINYKFNPNDIVWVVDTNSVRKGVCVQATIKVFQKSKTESQTEIHYGVIMDANEGTVWVLDADTYDNLTDAIDALRAQFVS